WRVWRCGPPSALTPRDRPVGGRALRKIVPCLTELPIFQIARQQKRSPHLFTDKGSHIVGANDRELKISTRATHTAAEKPLTGSTTTPSNCQSNCVGRNGLLLNAERPEPPANCDRRRHWIKATTALFVWREPGTITPSRPSQVKATLARPKRAPRLGFYDMANQEDQWPS